MGIADGKLKQVALADAALDGESLVDKGALGGHGDDAVEGVGAVEGAAGPDDEIDFLQVELGRAEEVAEGEVEAGGLVVHAVDDLEGAHRGGAVEAAGVDDLEAEAGAGEVHALHVAEGGVEVAAGDLLDGDGAHGFDGERGLLLFFGDAHADDLDDFHLDGVGAEFDFEGGAEAGDLEGERVVAEVGDDDVEGGIGLDFEFKVAFIIGHGACGAVREHDLGADEGVPLAFVADIALEYALAPSLLAYCKKDHKCEYVQSFHAIIVRF